MFGKKENFEEKINKAKYERIYKTLKSILDVEIKMPDGKQDIDYVATCSAIKTKARLAIDFVDEFSESSNKK